MISLPFLFLGFLGFVLQSAVHSPTSWAQTAQYRHHGTVFLPDPAVTPGAVRTRDPAELCATGFTTKSVRKTTAAMKAEVYRRYQTSPGQGVCARSCEVDHLVALTDGGADTLENLWPQPAEPRPGFHEKDKLEVWIHHQVCAAPADKAKALLEKYQQGLESDWYQLYLDSGLAKPKARRRVSLPEQRND